MSSFRIHVWVSDSWIFDFPKTIAKIIDAAHKYEEVILDLIEGPALENLVYLDSKLLDILNDLCLKNNWPKEKFSFISANLIQDNTVWTKIKYEGAFSQNNLEKNGFLYGQLIKNKIFTKNIIKHFGCLINGSAWPRLWISAFLYNKFQNKIFQTFRRNLSNPGHAINLHIDRLLFEFSQHKKNSQESLKFLSSFLVKIPIEKHTDKNLHNIEHFNWVHGALHEECLNWYNTFFVDIVCETYFSGKTFYPTEKIVRPIITKNPFIVFGPANYLQNLRKLGFKTFSKFWDETYDNFSGVLRINAIEKLIQDIAKYSVDDIRNIYDHMLPILEYNYSHFYSLSRYDVLSKFQPKSNKITDQ